MSCKGKRRLLDEPREIKTAIHDATRVLLDKVKSIMHQPDATRAKWKPPWRAAGHLHANVKTPWRTYKGINQVICQLVAEQEGYTTPRWITPRAAVRLGGRVRAGEDPVLLLGFHGRFVTRPVLAADGSWTTYTCKEYRLWQTPVFNVAQCEGLPEVRRRERKMEPWMVLQRAEKVITRMPCPPPIHHVAGVTPSYHPLLDLVSMPLREQFPTPGGYYESLFHELAHSTMHPDRLGRKASDVARGSSMQRYATEELIAEFGASHVLNTLGLQATTSTDQPAAYIAHWCQVLEQEPSIMLACAYAGEKAGRFILGKEKGKGSAAPVAATSTSCARAAATT